MVEEINAKQTTIKLIKHIMKKNMLFTTENRILINKHFRYRIKNMAKGKYA